MSNSDFYEEDRTRKLFQMCEHTLSNMKRNRIDKVSGWAQITKEGIGQYEQTF